MKHWMISLRRSAIFASVALAFMAFAIPAAAQDPSVGETPDSIAPETPDPMVEETPDAIAEEQAAEDEAAAAHDWEFALQPTDQAESAAGTVQVTEGETENDFVLTVTALPTLESLAQEDLAVGAYTVWIVPSKEQVQQSTLAGALSVDAEGNGTFESTTALETFGVIVTATADAAPAQISGIPVLTGIPAAAAVEETPAEEATPADTSAAEALPGETPAAEDIPPGETPIPEATPEAPEPPAVEPTPGADEPVPDAPTR
ncbi:MAG TPA: hypothetical protein VM737_00375 [Gemmatimonadota bacterium]|nr:hypothetical protein [Gemmatimonadota bacterium]